MEIRKARRVRAQSKVQPHRILQKNLNDAEEEEEEEEASAEGLSSSRSKTARDALGCSRGCAQADRECVCSRRERDSRARLGPVCISLYPVTDVINKNTRARAGLRLFLSALACGSCEVVGVPCGRSLGRLAGPHWRRWAGPSGSDWRSDHGRRLPPLGLPSGGGAEDQRRSEAAARAGARYAPGWVVGLEGRARYRVR